MTGRKKRAYLKGSIQAKIVGKSVHDGDANFNFLLDENFIGVTWSS